MTDKSDLENRPIVIVSQLARASGIEAAPEQSADFRRLRVKLVRKSLRIVAVAGKLGFEVVDLA